MGLRWVSENNNICVNWNYLMTSLYFRISLSLALSIYLSLVCFQFKNTGILEKNSHKSFNIYFLKNIFTVSESLNCWLTPLFMIYTRFLAPTPFFDVANTVRIQYFKCYCSTVHFE